MGQYEVTNEQYTKFLNSIAQEDGYHGLYNTKMGTNPNGGITRHGFNGSYSYRVIQGKEKWPVNFVSLWDALRFINWMHNGSPTGSQNLQTTESGAYTLLGARPQRIIRNFSAKYFLPNMDEWHKAAYYESFPLNRPSQSYWPTATKKAGIRMGISDADTANGSSTTLVDIGWYYYPSPWGTFNQAGNVAEWTETILSDNSRIVKGGSFMSGNLGAATGNPTDPNLEFENIGFRIGRVVEQDTTKTPSLRIDAVLIADPDNLDDDTIGINNTGIGSVAETFAMGRTEVTNSQYTIFLNAVAKTDSFHRLYNTQMQDDLNGGIIRSGSNQNDFQYSLKQGMANKPVNFVNIFDVMRFCNWLHNGAHRSSDTESGAYRLHREMDENNLRKIVRNPSARVFIPTEDEWHKAAFFESEPVGKPSQTYWKFATASDEIPSDSAVWGTTGLQSVGVGLASAYYTYNQSGNIAEWTESVSLQLDSNRITRGGSWRSSEVAELSKANRNEKNALTENDSLGFRVAFAYNPDAPSPLYRITGYEKPQDITPPVISLHGGGEVELEYGTPYEEAGYDAIDPEEGDLTSHVEVSGSINVYETGTYFKRYNVSDSSGNKAAEVVRTVKVLPSLVAKPQDLIPPLITLYGEASTTIANGGIWVDPGARAVDETDGDLSSMITITGLVDIETPGTYYLRYNVTDSSGNSAQEIVRTVRVPGIQNEYTLTIQHEGMGNVTGAKSGVYAKDVEFSVSAIPNEGYFFSSWSGDAYGSSETFSFKMDANKLIQAIFKKKNSAPIISNINADELVSFTVKENQIEVGIISATDPENDAFSFSISGTDSSLFVIHPTNGEIKFQNKPDYENPQDADSNNLYELNVQVFDGKESSPSTPVEIEIIDIEDVTSSQLNPSMEEVGSDEGYGWRGMEWLGIYYPTQDKWIYHLSHGWLFPGKVESENYWFFDNEIGWFWTGPAFYNENSKNQLKYIFSSAHSEWLFFSKDGFKRKFYLYSKSKWINPDGTDFVR